MSANVPYQTISRLAGRREGSQVRYLLRCQQRVTSSAKEIQAIAVLVDRGIVCGNLRGFPGSGDLCRGGAVRLGRPGLASAL